VLEEWQSSPVQSSPVQGRFHLSAHTAAAVSFARCLLPPAELLVTAYALCTLTLLGGVLGYYFEASTTNPDKNITSLAESLYWCIVTITTVGYGDMHPVSTGGKILSMAISLMGVLMFALPAGILGSGFVEVMQQHLQDEEEEQSKQIVQLTELVLALTEQSKSNQSRLEQRLTAIESRLDMDSGGGAGGGGSTGGGGKRT
jgi:voltage-gated potassium channel Kch